MSVEHTSTQKFEDEAFSTPNKTDKEKEKIAGEEIGRDKPVYKKDGKYYNSVPQPEVKGHVCKGKGCCGSTGVLPEVKGWEEEFNEIFRMTCTHPVVNKPLAEKLKNFIRKLLSTQAKSLWVECQKRKKWVKFGNYDGGDAVSIEDLQEIFKQ